MTLLRHGARSYRTGAPHYPTKPDMAETLSPTVVRCIFNLGSARAWCAWRHGGGVGSGVRCVNTLKTLTKRERGGSVCVCTAS